MPHSFNNQIKSSASMTDKAISAGCLLGKDYTIADKYFYIILAHLHEKYKNADGFFIGHDTITRNGVTPFKLFGLSQRACKSARRKLKDDGLIICRHIYGIKGHRIGTEYGICSAKLQENPRDVYDAIFNNEPIKLLTSSDLLNS